METVASASGVTKRLGQVQALSGVDLKVFAAEVVGLIGPNGAGKTTLIKCLAGLIRPDEGSIEIRGNNPFGPTASFVYESDALPLDMTVESFLRSEALAVGASPAAVRAAVSESGLTGARRRLIGTLSFGNRRRVSLAAALLGDADLIVMDEPTNGLDIDGLHMVRTLIADRKRRGRSVLFSSHTISEVERVADRVAVINHGLVLFDGPVDTLVATTGSPRLEDAYEAVLRQGHERC